MPSALLHLYLQDTILIGTTTTTTRGQASPSYGRPGCYSPSEHKTRTRLVSVLITKFTCSPRRQRATGKPRHSFPIVCGCYHAAILATFHQLLKNTHAHDQVARAAWEAVRFCSPKLSGITWRNIDMNHHRARLVVLLCGTVGGGVCCCCRRNYACCASEIKGCTYLWIYFWLGIGSYFRATNRRAVG